MVKDEYVTGDEWSFSAPKGPGRDVRKIGKRDKSGKALHCHVQFTKDYLNQYSGIAQKGFF